MQTGQVTNFAFSGVRPEKLGSTAYTLASIVMDVTGSVEDFAPALLEAKKTIIQACRKNPRAEFLMVRDVEFNTAPKEVHGFMDLQRIDENQYQLPDCRGMTALYDATYSAIAATNEYGRILSENDFNVNGVVFVVTDGGDNASAQTVTSIRKELTRGIHNEWIESLSVVLIGINAAQYRAAHEAFCRDANLSQYVDAGDATPQRLAKLADFVSRSISSSSQALGTGGPSQPLSF
ncbi:hypothetical protein F6X40_36455 [Paraburkholderia sp. UCT31]|uniref:hypothetical protein n=1 Tax=Paraburkholderia sp. UCT31 TaxID=2615209 RepID=UPI001655FC8D|nr:hypothetical protein [Paraburkholderia sp. UCT31]MBC8742034.1 hypothetical protein [Paraburkholderia sp. UCT31]